LSVDRHRRRSGSPRDRKRSRHSSNEKNGKTERKEEPRKSKTPRSVSRSRSHSKGHATPRQDSPGGANGYVTNVSPNYIHSSFFRRSRSRGSSIGNRNETAGSPSAAEVHEDNTFE
jgi:hypothetical protein